MMKQSRQAGHKMLPNTKPLHSSTRSTPQKNQPASFGSSKKGPASQQFSATTVSVSSSHSAPFDASTNSTGSPQSSTPLKTVQPPPRGFYTTPKPPPPPKYRYVSVRASASTPAPVAPTTKPEMHWKPRHPTLVVERFPNWQYHLQVLRSRLGQVPNARPSGQGVRFTPWSDQENMEVRRYLAELEKTEKLHWFALSLPAK